MSKTYSLTAAGKKFAKECDPKTHAGIVIAAIRKNGGKATSKQITELSAASFKKVSDMRPSDAVSFMLFHLSRERGGNVLKATK